MKRDHVVMLAGQDLVAHLDDQPVRLVVEPLAVVVGVGRRLLQDGVGGDHLARDEILADAEMLERPLGLRAPQFIGWHAHFAKAVGLLAYVCHGLTSREFAGLK
jgi:hypothetical protein